MIDRHICKAKRIDTGKWVEGYVTMPSTVDNKDNPVTYHFNAADGWGSYERVIVSAETVCRCTGLPDKNGNIIFEKDAIKVTEDFEEIYVVEWDEDIARYVFVQNGNTITDFGDIYASDTKVIGNIIDNPELMKGGAE